MGINNRSTKLYNVIFPIWLLAIFPLSWIIVLPANFAVDLLVVYVAMRVMKLTDIKQKIKPIILKVWIFGFASDIIGGIFMFLAMLMPMDNAFGEWWYNNVQNSVALNPFETIYGFLYVTVCVFISAACIYFFNYKISLRKAALEIKQKKKISLILAAATAPYLFYLPTIWFVSH